MKKRTEKGFWDLAFKKKAQLDGIIHTIAAADFLSNKNHLVKEAKQNLEKCLHKIEKSDVALKAKHLAKAKGNELRSWFNVPSKRDITKLNSRLSQLEKRFKSLSRRAAAH